MIKGFIKGAILAAGAALIMSGCSSGGGAGGGGSSNITISGALSSSNVISPTSNGKTHRMLKTKSGVSAMSLADLEIYVIYTIDTTVGITRADVDSTTGAWSFSVPTGSQINAIVRNTVTLELVGPIVFVDSTNTDLSGNPSSSTVASFKSGVSVGTITLNEEGKFEVDVTVPEIAESSGTSAAAPDERVDFSGPWTIAAYDKPSSMPTGYMTALTPGTSDCPSVNDCHGPAVGQEVYILRLTGNKFTYSGGNCATWKSSRTGSCTTADGTVDSTVVKEAASLWGGADPIADCGYKLGFVRDDALAGGGISIAPADLPSVNSHQMTYGLPTYTTDPDFGGDGAGSDEPWMYTGAEASYNMNNCYSATKTGADSNKYQVNICTGTLHNAGTSAYGASVGGGCVDADNHPVKIYDWSQLNGSTCTSPVAWTPISGMWSMSCPYTGISPSVASAAAFTCTSTYGVFSNANLSSVVTGDWIDSWDGITAGTPCKNIVDDLQRYRCYANAYWQHRPSGGCVKRYDFNWGATDVADFVVDNHRDKPEGQFLTNLVTYSADGNSFFLEDHEGGGVQVQSGSSSTTFCSTDRTTLLKGTKVNSTKMLIELNESVALQDTTNAACVAAKNDSTSNSGQGSELYQRMHGDSMKSYFYLVK